MCYSTDLTEEQWKVIEPVFAKAIGKYGGRSTQCRHKMTNAVFYITKTGCQWRLLPNDFPKWKTVYSFYRRMKIKGVWEQINDLLVRKSRVSMGRRETPTYGLIDSQSVKTTGKGECRGVDGGKKNQRPQKTYCD